MLLNKIKYLLLFFVLTYASVSQIKNLTLSGGVSTMEILGSNPNNALIVSRDPDEVTLGGSFDGPQLGFGLKLGIPLDENNRFVVPIGLDYYFFEALERIPSPGRSESKWKHTSQIAVPTIGFNYSFLKFPYANVRAYAGVELRTSIIQQGKWTQKIKDTISTSITRSTKETAFRFGGAIILGFVGDIVSPLYINAYVGLGVMNLLGRDNIRGELLTPKNYIETKESIIYNLHFSLLLQLRI